MSYNILPVHDAVHPSASKGTTKPIHLHHPSKLLWLVALGVVFGDIGTSPLYTFNVLLGIIGPKTLIVDTILGIVSLVFWTLILVTSVKYISFVMKMNNHGEGGLLALMSLVIMHGYKKPWVIFAGLIGSALLYGDGALTPAISILSALEGLQLAFSFDHKVIVPIAIVVLLILFAIQPYGSAIIGKAFGPIMLIWFIALGALGLIHIIDYPVILKAFNPYYAFTFIANNLTISLIILGAVFLSVTGAEALYADMGHFGIKPIRQGWFCLVFPSLLLNYAGQGALVLKTGITSNIFFSMVPGIMVIPLVILATLATVIASQALITGAFSLSRQAIQLGWLPNMKVVQTSETGQGQIYIGFINFILFLLCVLLVIHFRTSENLAAAYGISVSLMMLVTTLLLGVVVRKIWQWPLALTCIILGVFLLIDLVFVTANIAKFFHGGYIPITLSLFFVIAMYIWRKGLLSISRLVRKNQIDVVHFFNDIEQQNIPRVEGLGVFLTHAQESIPPVMYWHVKRNHSLAKTLISITVISENVPWITDETRTTIIKRAEGYYHINAHFGFMEKTNIPLLLSNLNIMNFKDFGQNITYYLGVESIMIREKHRLMPKWQTLVFSWFTRNSMKVSDLFYLPDEQVVEIGRRVSF